MFNRPRNSVINPFSFEFDNAFVRWMVNLITRLLGPNYWVQDVDYEKYSLVVSCEK